MLPTPYLSYNIIDSDIDIQFFFRKLPIYVDAKLHGRKLSVVSYNKRCLFAVCDEIRAVIGKTRLIISQRFTQFIKLVNKAEDNSNKTITRPVFESDLDGFWEMDYIQVFS